MLTLLFLGYDLAVHVYCMQDQRPIADGTLERTILSVAMSFYDGASNGNRTRGGVRKASEMYSKQHWKKHPKWAGG